MNSPELTQIKQFCSKKLMGYPPEVIQDAESHLVLQWLETGTLELEKFYREFRKLHLSQGYSETSNIKQGKSEAFDVYEMSADPEIEDLEISLVDELDIVLEVLNLSPRGRRCAKKLFLEKRNLRRLWKSGERP